MSLHNDSLPRTLTPAAYLALALASLSATFPVGAAPPFVAEKIAEIHESGSVQAFDFAPDSKTIAVTAEDSNAIHLWALQSHPHIKRIISAPSTPRVLSTKPILKYSPDGHRLALLHRVDDIRDLHMRIDIWNPDTGELQGSIGGPADFPASHGLAFSEDGESIFTFYDPSAESGEHDLDVYGSDTCALDWRLSLGSVDPAVVVTRPSGHVAAIGVTAYKNSAILIFDAASRIIVRTLDAFPTYAEPGQIAWSRDGNLIAAGAIVRDGYADEQAVKIFSLPTGALIASANPPQHNVAGFAFAADDKYVVISTRGLKNVVTIWDASLTGVLQSIPLRHGLGGAIAVSANGQFMAVAENDRVSIWQIT